MGYFAPPETGPRISGSARNYLRRDRKTQGLVQKFNEIPSRNPTSPRIKKKKISSGDQSRGACAINPASRGDGGFDTQTTLRGNRKPCIYRFFVINPAYICIQKSRFFQTTLPPTKHAFHFNLKRKITFFLTETGKKKVSDKFARNSTKEFFLTQQKFRVLREAI